MKKGEMTYHFYCLKGCVILQMNDVGNGNIRSTVRKSCHERLVKILIHLD